MAEFKQAVLTTKGIALLAKAQAESKTIAFTRAVTGSGTYEDGEDLAAKTSLKELQQSFAPTTITRKNETNVFVRFSITNNHPTDGPLLHGYYVTEIGLMAQDPDEGEILYGIAIGETGKCDYLPAYNNLLPATIGVDFLIEVDNSENVTITTDLSAYATNADLNAKADGIGYDEQTNEVQLKANNQVISRAVISFSAYAEKDQLNITYDSNTNKLKLKHGDDELSETTIISGGGGGGSIATKEEIDEIVDYLMDGPDLPVPEDAEIATDDEVDDMIDNLDNL